MQLSFKEYSHHQRSHYDTITIGPKEMINWVLKSTVEQQPVGKIVRQSCGEVQHATFSQLTQPIPKPICDRSGKPDSTEDVFVVKGETSRSHEINEKGFHGELCSSDRSGQPDNLSENIRVEQTHDGSGQPDERNSSSAHMLKEQHAHEVQSGSTVEHQPVGKLVQQSFGEVPRVKLSKPTRSKPNPICDRSGKPEDTERVFVDKGKTSRSQEIDDKRLHKKLGSSDRSGKPVKLSEDIRVMHAHD